MTQKTSDAFVFPPYTVRELKADVTRDLKRRGCVIERQEVMYLPTDRGDHNLVVRTHYREPKYCPCCGTPQPLHSAIAYCDDCNTDRCGHHEEPS